MKPTFLDSEPRTTWLDSWSTATRVTPDLFCPPPLGHPSSIPFRVLTPLATGAVVKPVGTSVLASVLVRIARLARPARVSLAALIVALLSSSSAFAQTTTVTAAWDRNTDSMTTGYMVYYGTSSGSYQWSYDAGNQTSAQLSINQGSTYFMAVRAYNSSAQVGPPSNEVTFGTGGGAPTATLTATLQGSSAVVTWSTTNAVSATINGVAAGLSGTTTVPVTSTTTFTLVATSGSGATATRSATVTVTPPAAPTAQLTATLQGTNALLTWSTTNATTALINGQAVALSGSASVPVTATTTFTLVATNASGVTATRSATVTVAGPAAPTAQITATLQGSNAAITWSTTNAVSASINGVAVGLSGSTTVPVSTTTTFTLLATNSAGGTATRSATVTVAPPSPPPPPPTGAPTAQLTATLQGTTAVLTWQTGNAIRAEINGGAVALNGTMSVPVSASTTFRLLATAASGQMIDSIARVTVSPTPTPTGAPMAPTSMTTTVSGARVTFSWRAPASGAAPDRYLLDVGVSGTSTMLVSGYSVGTALSVSADLPKGSYFARVRAANGTGASPYSNLAQFRVGRTLASPRGLSVRWSGTTAVLSWTVATGDGTPVEDIPTQYVLEAGTAQGMADVASVNLGNTTTFSAPIPSGTYYVRVRAANAYGDSNPTPDLVLVPPGAPNAPTTLVHSRVNGIVNLRWNAPTGPAPTGYLIEAGTAPGLSNLARAEVGTATTFSTPIPAGTYYVRVRAVGARGPGLPSNEVIVR